MRFNTSEGESLEYGVPPHASGQRLDQFLTETMLAPSRTFVKRLIDMELVRVEPGKAKPAYRLKGGERLVVFVPDLVVMSAEPEAIPLSVLHEDEHCIVLNKQAGLVVHPSPGHETGTLVNALLHHCQDLSGIGGTLRPGIVHRLDRDTTGCIVCAKSDAAHQELAAQFAARAVGKTYLALTQGCPQPAEGTVEGEIGRHPHPKHRQMFAMVESGGRHSLTRYRTLETFGEIALVECVLETGRTHQIRVHMRHLRSPILCDEVYGKGVDGLPPALCGAIRRQALHAWKLEIAHPATLETMAFEAALPDDMEDALRRLRAEGGEG